MNIIYLSAAKIRFNIQPTNVEIRINAKSFFDSMS